MVGACSSQDLEQKLFNNLSDLRGPYESGAVEAASFESLSDQARNKTKSSLCLLCHAVSSDGIWDFCEV